MSNNRNRKDDGVQAMERLKSVYLLAFISLAAVPALGQQTAPPDSNTRTFAVVGDVENCNTYPVPPGTTLTVRQAVINAGLVSESVNVMVIRSAQDRPQWTQSVSATSADKGERVESGDVLVVQAMSPLTAAVRKNAALRSDFGVAVVSLEQDGIVIGDVLQATHTPPPADGQLKIISRFSGQTPIGKAELYHPIVHGDVISVSRSNRTVMKGFGSMSPAVSEWKNSGTTAARDPFVPSQLPSSDHSLTSSQSIFQPLQLPTSLEGSIVLAAQDVESPEVGAAESDNEEEIPAILVPALSMNPAEDVEDADSADNKVSLDSGSMAVAPVAPSEIQISAITNPTATAFNPWNLVFMGGLLLAGTLILAGTLKPESDDDKKSSNFASTMKTSEAQHIGATPVSHRKWTESPRPQSVAMPVSHTAESLPKIQPEIRSDSAVRVPTALVADHEWFSGDWHGPIAPSEFPSQEAAEAGDSVPASNGRNHVHVAIKSSEKTIDSSKNSVVSENSVGSEVESGKTLSSAEQSFSDLEDLLQNRLPIDLCETQLPLRLVVFGKPAGPRRLRIDAAHSTIPAPHMNLSREKRREQTVAASSAAAAHSATAHAPTQTPSVVETTGSLDRALHFLHERTES